MALLASALNASRWTPLDDRWYSPWLGASSDAGVAVGPETIFNCATVLAAVRFKAEAVAVCTPHVGRRMPDGSRMAVPSHPLQRVLRQPNQWQTGFEWTRLMVTWLAIYGNAYSRIVPSRRYFVGQLWPMHPERVRVVDQGTTGELVFEYRNPRTGETERLVQGEVHHYGDLSTDGVEGMVTHRLIQNIVGVAMAAGKHSATFLRKGVRLSGVLTTDSALDDPSRKQVESAWATAYGGNDNVGKVAVLGRGFKFSPLAIDHQKAQFIELQDHQVQLILMALGVPGVVVGYQGDKASTYASADAFFEKGGVKHCVLPIVTNMEQRDESGLLLADDDPHYVKRNLDVLQRANTRDRYESLVRAVGGPFMTQNEARAIEDLNRHDDPDADGLLRPVNMQPISDDDPDISAPPPRQRQPQPANDDEDGGDDDTAEAASSSVLAMLRLVSVTARERDTARGMAALGRELARRNAEAVVRREIAAIWGRKTAQRQERGAAVRFASDPVGWRTWVEDFYRGHVDHVAERLAVRRETAAIYASEQREQLLAFGAGVVGNWEERAVARLLDLTLAEISQDSTPAPAANL